MISAAEEPSYVASQPGAVVVFAVAMQLLFRCDKQLLPLDAAENESVASLTSRLEQKLGYASTCSPHLRLLHSGRQLSGEQYVRSAASGATTSADEAPDMILLHDDASCVFVSSGSEFHAVARVRGGGGDGGVYPLTHAELKWMTPSEMGVSGKAWTKQWSDKATEETIRIDRCTLCSASTQPLTPPIVVTELGYLCNKEALIEGLLSKTLPPHLSHVKSLKDVLDAKLTPNPHAKPDADFKAGADTAEMEVPFCCPVADVPFNGRHPFVYLKPSGYVVSERAYKQMGGSKCPISEVPCTADDVIILNGNEEQREQLAERAAARKLALKEQKRKAKLLSAAAPACAGVEGAQPSGGSGEAAAPASSSAGAADKPHRASASAHGGKARAHDACAKGAGAVGAPKRGREWEQVVAQKSKQSSVYKSLFVSKEQREHDVATSNNNFCARGIPMSLSRSTKFTM